MAITRKQQRFVDEYLIDLNATQAAIRAGYSEKTAYSQGQRLLNNVEIQAAIQAAQLRLAERTEITQDQVMLDIESIKRDAMQVRYDADGNAFMLSHKDALKACELQGRRLGMFNDKLNVQADATLNIILNKPIQE